MVDEGGEDDDEGGEEEGRATEALHAHTNVYHYVKDCGVNPAFRMADGAVGQSSAQLDNLSKTTLEKWAIKCSHSTERQLIVMDVFV